MLGQGLQPRNYHHMGALIGDERVRRALESLKGNIAGAVASMPSHSQFLERYCAPATA
jgi:tryptophan halogenase